ncbi:MAG: metallophosphoesterase [Deferribacteraceae bacterium]|jgi:putative phosphoesterase|nr:metallophosphoesterase [Deferribacteraceae bacterium]
MRILITSDTHAKRYLDLPLILREEIKRADAVIHAGDYGSVGFFNEFVAMCTSFYGVLGNNDRLDLPEELMLELDSVRIAAVHGDDMLWGERCSALFKRFQANRPHIIVYGHTHRWEKEKLSNTLLLNPGSPTKPRGVHSSFALLETSNGSFTVDIIMVKGSL